MTYIIMHKTDAHWETGALPSQDLIMRVGQMVGDLARRDILRAGEGLRPSSEGVRLSYGGGTRTVTPGPFEGRNELPASFSILSVESVDDAVDWASRYAQVVGEAEFDIRPVTEPWDMGMGEKPAGQRTRRYMALRKATSATEAEQKLSREQQRDLDELIEESTRTRVHLVTVAMRSSARGRRFRKKDGGISSIDGPFAESKEMIGGYVIVDVPSLDEAAALTEQYLAVVDAPEVDVREIDSIIQLEEVQQQDA